MTKEEIDKRVDEWFRKNYLYLRREISNNICKDGMNVYTDDLMQYMVLWFLERSDSLKQDLLEKGLISNYILRGASIQLKSSTSPFYQKIRKFKMSVREGNQLPEGSTDDHSALENDALYQCMMRELQNLHWYYRTLIQQKYFEGLTLNEMRQKYNITLASLTKDIKIGYAIIRERCNCELE